MQVTTNAKFERDTIDDRRALEREVPKLRGASTPKSRAWTLAQLVEEWCKSQPENNSADKDRSACKRGFCCSSVA